MLLISSIAIGLLYGAGLLWGQNTHLSVAEYWRWWVVHLWVEGVFEVFATAIIAFLFVKMGLLRASTASISVLFAALIFLSGGVLGTFHHFILERHADRRVGDWRDVLRRSKSCRWSSSASRRIPIIKSSAKHHRG